MNQAMLPIVAALAANMEPCWWIDVVISMLVCVTALSGGLAITWNLVALFDRDARQIWAYVVAAGAFVASWGYMALRLTTA